MKPEFVAELEPSKAGRLKILELCEKARNAPKTKVDLKDFHGDILGNGSEWLKALEDVVDLNIQAGR